MQTPGVVGDQRRHSSPSFSSSSCSSFSNVPTVSLSLPVLLGIQTHRNTSGNISRPAGRQRFRVRAPKVAMMVHIGDVMRDGIVRKSDPFARRKIGGSAEGVPKVTNGGPERREETGLVHETVVEGGGGCVAEEVNGDVAAAAFFGHGLFRLVVLWVDDLAFGIDEVRGQFIFGRHFPTGDVTGGTVIPLQRRREEAAHLGYDEGRLRRLGEQ
mmetsp:Transcript_2836/g.6190  ORF Transcript_2836/g.6190 Transcript_2836/m.6190 type:complete len:213 (-) Transcript_2836:243-881(-)